MSKLLSEFRSHWNRQFPKLHGKAVLLAVSGGADSMALAHLFKANGFPFAVAHCNFGLRGEASGLDEQLVRGWCAANDILVHVIGFDTKQAAANWKKGTQETARILRYDWFEQVRKEQGYAAIVTAHHANDNVETLLINLFRGTGINGIHGILPEHGHIVRPLLFATREMLDEYVREEEVPFREDESNATDDYLRNAVRHKIIPAAQKLFTNAIVNVNESISRFAEAGQIYNAAVARERKALIEKRGPDYYIPVRKLQLREPLATICYELIQPFGFSPAQVPHVLALLSSGSGHFIVSPTHRIIRNRDFLVVTTLATEDAGLIEVQEVPSVIHTGAGSFSFAVGDRPAEIPTGTELACIDLSAITFPLVLRKWRTGDYFYPLGMGMKKKKVSRLLIDLKVPLHHKEQIMILESGKRIVWVAGIRLDERFKIKPTTNRVLTVTRKTDK